MYLRPCTHFIEKQTDSLAPQSIDLLRSLLGEVPGSPATANPGAPAAAAAAGGADKHTLVDEDGELAKVARGRLEWLTRRLRAELSSELGRALREVDPLAAAAGDSQGQGAESGLPGPDEERRREGLARVEVKAPMLVSDSPTSGWECHLFDLFLLFMSLARARASLLK